MPRQLLIDVHRHHRGPGLAARFGPAYLNPTAINHAAHAHPGRALKLRHLRDVSGLRHNCPGDGMLRSVLHGCRQPQHLVLFKACLRLYAAHGHDARRDRARLIHHNGGDFLGVFQHFRALNQQSHLGTPAGPHQQGGGGGQPQSTGAGDNQHGYRRRECLGQPMAQHKSMNQ